MYRKIIFYLFFSGVNLTNPNSTLWIWLGKLIGSQNVIFVVPVIFTFFMFLGLYILADYIFNPIIWNRLFIEKYKFRLKNLLNFLNIINTAATLMLFFRKKIKIII